MRTDPLKDHTYANTERSSNVVCVCVISPPLTTSAVAMTINPLDGVRGSTIIKTERELVKLCECFAVGGGFVWLMNKCVSSELRFLLGITNRIVRI